jgi:hypothetical protein
MTKSNRWDDALSRLAAAEERFLANEFLAPVVRGGLVQVRIAGVICRLKVQPADFQGWGVFRPRSHTGAQLVRTARLAERQRYLALFPLVRLILTRKHDDQWLGIPAHRADSRLRIEGMVPIRLVEEVQLFDVVESRFDGSQFWFAGPDPRWDPGAAAYLRRSLDQLAEPEKLSRPGLMAEERMAYAANYGPRFQATKEARRDRNEKRLRAALAHAGAELKEYRERDEVYTVTYEVDGEQHVSVVSKQDLSVQMAGICLSGQDENFDLQSLVGVLREAQGSGAFVRVGHANQGMEEEAYWRVHHPPHG